MRGDLRGALGCAHSAVESENVHQHTYLEERLEQGTRLEEKLTHAAWRVFFTAKGSRDKMRRLTGVLTVEGSAP